MGIRGVNKAKTQGWDDVPDDWTCGVCRLTKLHTNFTVIIYKGKPRVRQICNMCKNRRLLESKSPKLSKVINKMRREDCATNVANYFKENYNECK